MLAVAVADGVGSAPKSDEGSGAATEIAVEELINLLSVVQGAELEQYDFKDWGRTLVGKWQNRFGPARQDFDTTLLFCGLTQTTCVLGQIGDGLILLNRVGTPDGYELFQPNRKDFLNMPGDCLASPLAADTISIACRPVLDIDTIILATDGITDDLADPEDFARSLREMMAYQAGDSWSEILAALLRKWPTPGHYDDKTIAFVHRPRSAARTMAPTSTNEPPVDGQGGSGAGAIVDPTETLGGGEPERDPAEALDQGSGHSGA